MEQMPESHVLPVVHEVPFGAPVGVGVGKSTHVPSRPGTRQDEPAGQLRDEQHTCSLPHTRPAAHCRSLLHGSPPWSGVGVGVGVGVLIGAHIFGLPSWQFRVLQSVST